MKNDQTLALESLINLVKRKSKHSDYQTLHPNVESLFQEGTYQPSGKSEVQRLAYMRSHQTQKGLSILDIGANTGFFSIAAIEEGACQVVSQEGNIEHAKFIELSSRCLGLENKIEVRATYFDFNAKNAETLYDLTLCLNVLHHLGDDFGERTLSLDSAKKEMTDSLNQLAYRSSLCWMQIGFNWKGNPEFPLFVNGTKSELVNFIKQSIQGYWAIERVGVVDPISRSYVDANDENMQRYDSLGEFLNRPLFLLRSLICNSPIL